MARTNKVIVNRSARQRPSRNVSTTDTGYGRATGGTQKVIVNPHSRQLKGN